MNTGQSDLGPKQQAVLILSRQGWTPREIAGSLNTSTQAVYKLIRKLRAKGYDLNDEKASA